MQDAKDLAFLMHPNHRTDATEGSRTAHGQAAGCIKKAPAEAGASRACGQEGEREEKPADASGADGEARAGLREHGGGERGWEPDWDGWLAEKAARRAAAQGGGHGSALCLCGLGGDQLGQFGVAVHVVERDGQTPTRAEVDDLACHVWREGLASLVVTYVSLGATDAIGHRLLGNAEAFSDGLEVVHAANSSAARKRCQYRRYFVVTTAALIICYVR